MASKFDVLTKFLQKEQNVSLPSLLAHLQCSEVYCRNLMKRAESQRMAKFLGRGQWVTTMSNFVTPSDEPKEDIPELPKISVEERFGYITDLVNMVISGTQPSLFLTGESGIGKSFIVRKALADKGLKEDSDYLFIKGHSSPLGLYTLLHNNRDACLVFDDSDNAFKESTSANLLKSALDSYDKRMITWYSNRAESQGLEQKFEFNGKVIFISNIPLHQVDPAIRSRSFCYNLHLSTDELIVHMNDILQHIEPQVDMEKKKTVLNFISDYKNNWQNFNLRLLIQAIRISTSFKEEQDWKNMIRVLSAGSF